MALSAKQKAFRLGLRAESYAAWYLRGKGFAILARRYKTHHGEIDLIAQRGCLVLIVEVKARPTIKEAMEAVSFQAKQRIEATALHWLKHQPNAEKLTLRFDLIAMRPYRFPHHIKSFFI